MYIEKNVNPKGNTTGDCVIRATALYLGKSWEEVYTDLCKLGMEMSTLPNSPDVYKVYYKKHGLTYVSCSKNLKGKKRPKVKELSKEEGIFRVANHLTVAKGGDYFDIWDCGDSAVYGYWTKKQESALERLLKGY